MSSYHDIFGSMKEQADSSMSHVSQAVDVTRNQDYAFRAPSPPHINIRQSHEEYNVQFPSFHQIWCGNEQFLRFIRETLDRSNLSLPNQEWRYEQRREAQQILPFLYLGPSGAARDIEFLKRENITMLLVVRDSAMARVNLLDGTRVAQQLGIESETIDIHSTIDYIPAFPHAVRVINEHVSSVFQQSNSSKIGKVLVFCESGNDRSAVVVSAYLMATCGLDLASSVHRIQSRRFCVSFNDRMKNLLLSYLSILNAKKDVAFAEPQASIPSSYPTSGTKRGRNEGYHEEETPSDKERFVGRTNLAPFR
ncbi:Serine/threonine/tyrosine-interacting protein [Erysiphe neolycopersici]|uniref:Serine/threonine/tyrosine-interacting protein n=1 Tax=Erysiphe neolycopersici TaxID=212602 RepID=A0A420HUY5_9PEZI|nr:Serine/threonine/tyrosine-interacting protein [Erysiphe neolycopersici]